MAAASRHLVRHRPRDPRHYQIAVLGSLVVYALLALDLEVSAVLGGAMLATALATQAVCSRLVGLPRLDLRSPLISGLSLCLLLRTDSLAWAVVAAVVTIASKFLLRSGGKHIFNPTNFGLVVVILLSGQAWISPGQWGSAALLAFLMAGIGILVVHRAERSDVTWAFLAAYQALQLGRALWLGDPWTIPLHRMQSGALLLFAFFMISDPKTTPDSRAGRIAFAALVATGGFVLQTVYFRADGLLYALAVGSLTVPLFDRWLPGLRYRWPGLSRVFAPPLVERTDP